jgi:hypothetical protein
VVESSNGRDWHRADPPADDPAEMVAVAAGPGGAMLAAGSITRGAGPSELAVWRRDIGGIWSEPTRPADLPRDLAVPPGGIAGGRAGFMISGVRDNVAEIWTSPDGERWRRAEGYAGSSDPVIVVADEFVVFASRAEEHDPSVVDVLTSAEGDRLENVGELAGPGLAMVRDATYVAGRFLAVGGQRATSDGDFTPALWVSYDAATWTPGPPLHPGSGGGSNLGTWAMSVAARFLGMIVVTSEDGSLWASFDDGESFQRARESLPRAPVGLGWGVVVPDGVPTAFSAESLYGLVGGGWADRGADVVPRSQGSVDVGGVAHGAGGFVAVGTTSQPDATENDGLSSHGAVWRSPDGRTWVREPDEATLAGTELLDVAAYEGGFVAVGVGDDVDGMGVARVFVSADGSDWTPVRGEGLVPPGNGVHQLESVVAYGGGFVATGPGYTGSVIDPLILVSADGTSISRARVPGATIGDLVTGGVCADGEAAVVVGVEQTASTRAVAWTSDDAVTWHARPTDGRHYTSFTACSVSADGTVVAGGSVLSLGGATTAPALAGGPAPLALVPLPGSLSPEIVSAVSWVDGALVAIGDGLESPSSRAVVWIATDGEEALDGRDGVDPAAFDRVVLTGPGAQGATGLAAGEGVVVVTGRAPGGGAVWAAPIDDLLDR